MRKIILPLILIPSLILVDFITKIVFLNKFIEILPFFYISTIINTGTISGFLRDSNLFLIFASFAILGLIIWLYVKEVKLRFGLNFIIGGALGNLISRFIYGGVVDFIYLVPFGTFNLADVFIDLGIIICIYKTLRH